MFCFLLVVVTDMQTFFLSVFLVAYGTKPSFRNVRVVKVSKGGRVDLRPCGGWGSCEISSRCLRFSCLKPRTSRCTIDIFAKREWTSIYAGPTHRVLPSLPRWYAKPLAQHGLRILHAIQVYLPWKAHVCISFEREMRRLHRLCSAWMMDLMTYLMNRFHLLV